MHCDGPSFGSWSSAVRSRGCARTGQHGRRARTLDSHERTMGRSPDPEQLAAWCSTWRASFDRLRELRRQRETSSAYAVTLGSHFELLAENERAAEGVLAEVVGGPAVS